MSYYLYTGGVLKLVDREHPPVVNNVPKHLDREYYERWKFQIKEYKKHIESLPSIAVSDDLK